MLLLGLVTEGVFGAVGGGAIVRDANLIHQSQKAQSRLILT